MPAVARIRLSLCNAQPSASEIVAQLDEAIGIDQA
jgi:hypothetical protein